MGLMRKVVRRATPRPVRQVKRVVRHPARTAIRAATPRPIRNVQRTAFKVAHPVNAAENALLNSLTGSKRRPKSGRRGATAARDSGGDYAAGPNSYAATYERAWVAEQIGRHEEALLSQHLVSYPAARPPVAPPIEPPNTVALRERLMQDSGASAHAENLGAFGDPPTAPAPSPVDERSLFKDIFATESSGISRLHWRRRQRLRAAARVKASEQAHVETELRLTEHRRAQQRRGCPVARRTL